MGSTYYSLHYHIIFSTYERRRFLHVDWRHDLLAYIGGTARGLNARDFVVGGVDDHVHLNVSLTPSHRLADFVRDVKKSCSAWIREHHDPTFKWQEGYGAFTIAKSQVPVLDKYIRNQEEHHRKVDYRQEWLRLLEVHGLVEYPDE
jgi:REP element-mobilizing transposase RayT